MASRGPATTAAGQPSARSRADRLRMPVAKDLVKHIAIRWGVCVRPVPVRRTDPSTGESQIVDVPCGATLTSKCPPCAERARLLRMAQAREGWHLEEEPDLEPVDPTDEQRELATLRADLEAARFEADGSGQDATAIEEAIRRVEEALAASGVQGTATPSHRRRRTRSTRRRQDAPNLPRQKVAPRTLGKTYAAPDGKTFRPSMWATLTCRSYGRVDKQGVPVNFDRYDYRGAARDAIHFAKAVDRALQNLRRFLGYELQYFGAVEPQRRLAPHLHILMRGTLSRAALRQVVAATYHQVWWPSAETVVYPNERLPVWDEPAGGYVDPKTGEPLPTWDRALDAIGPGDAPHHVVRFGDQIDARGVLAGTPEAEKFIGYVAKYLTKQIDSCHDVETTAQEEQLYRMWEALRYEPCSPTCANWLRYGVQPKNPRPGLSPGFCKGKAHRRETLGFGGRRVLVSRKWTVKTLAEHRADRRNWVRELLGLPDDPDPRAYLWEQADPTDPDVLPREQRLLLAVANRSRWREQRRQAEEAAKGTAGQPDTAPAA